MLISAFHNVLVFTYFGMLISLAFSIDLQRCRAGYLLGNVRLL